MGPTPPGHRAPPHRDESATLDHVRWRVPPSPAERVSGGPDRGSSVLRVALHLPGESANSPRSSGLSGPGAQLVRTFAAGLAVVLMAPAATAQDFDPRGRRHGAGATPTSPPPALSVPKTSAPGPKLREPSSSPLPKAGTPAAPAEEKSGAGSAVLIARYTAVVLADPASPFPLQRLAQLYRERDGNLKGLTAEFEKRAQDTTGGDSWRARMALGAIYQADGRTDDAIKTYQEAVAAKPKEATPLLLLGQLSRDRNDATSAKQYYERALPLVSAKDLEPTLRSLLTLSLDLKDFEAAKKFHRDLVKRSQNSLLVRGELGRELEARGDFEHAEAEFREVVTAAGGDNRTLAPALRDLGRVLAKAHKNTEALATLKKALALAGGEAGVRGELFALITDVYRAENTLNELIRLLEAEHLADAPRLVMLGALYEETGQVDKALATYRHALDRAPRNIDVRVKVIHLLQSQGELEQAIREYEALIRAAPHNPDYSFELCDTLIQRGDRPRALAILNALEQRASHDEEILARLSDFYEKIEEKQKALAVLQRLSSIAPGDPSHLVELGDRFYQQGDKKKAQETWNRIKLVVPNRAKALAALGEVYLDHDMQSEGVDALKEASQLEPTSVPYRKAYAVALERTASTVGATALSTARLEEARALWEGLLTSAKGDKNLAREVRAHIVTLFNLLHQLEQQVPILERRFSRLTRPTSRQGASSPRSRPGCASSPRPRQPCDASRPSRRATPRPSWLSSGSSCSSRIWSARSRYSKS